MGFTTQNEIDAYVGQSLQEQADKYLGQVSDAKMAAQTEITNQANAVNALARNLDTNFLGFLTGALPPAQLTSNAGVTLREPGVNHLEGSSDGTVKKGMNIVSVIGLGFLIYYLFIRRKKRGIF